MLQVVLAPDLSGLSKEISTSELLYFSLNDDNQLVNDGTLLEHDFIGFVVPGLHVLENSFFILLYQGEQKFILLKSVLHVVLEHHLPVHV